MFNISIVLTKVNSHVHPELMSIVQFSRWSAVGSEALERPVQISTTMTYASSSSIDHLWKKIEHALRDIKSHNSYFCANNVSLVPVDPPDLISIGLPYYKQLSVRS